MRKLLFELQQELDIHLLHCDMFPYEGEKIINLHIMEQTMMNVAAGIAYTKTPVLVYGVSGFVFLKALEQIKFSIQAFGAKYAPILWFNAGHIGCYDHFGIGHQFKEELELCKIYNIDVFTPKYEDFKMICKELLKTNGLKYIRLGADHEN